MHKHGTQIHGVPIVGGLESLAYAVDRYRVGKIAIGTTQLSAGQIATIRAFAEGMGLEVTEVGFGLRRMPSSEPPHTSATKARTA